MNYIKSFFLSILTFFMPVISLVLLVIAFVICDTVTGVWAARVSGETITSRKLGNVVPKLILYQLALFIGYSLDIVLLGEFIQYVFAVNMLTTKLIAMTLIFIEVISLNENIERITNKNIFQYFQKMIKNARDIKRDAKNM